MNTRPEICLKSCYTDDERKLEAGQGLLYVPLLSQELVGIDSVEWLMSPSEQMGVIYLLEKLRPEVSIEIGTRFGGSLQVLATLSKKVYSLDIDPEVPSRLGKKYSNVEYIIGSSRQTIPILVDRLNGEGAAPSFVLIDGDHTPEGVRADIENILRLRPRGPLFIVMHDSYNPQCREGMTSVDWEKNPHVHAVELDFVSGTVFPRGDLWGGLGLAVMLPEKRLDRLEVTGRGNRAVSRLLPGHHRMQFKTRVSQSISYHLRRLGFGRKAT